MADEHIEINTTTRLGFELREVVDTLATTEARLKQLVATMTQQTDAVDWSVVEARFGVPAGKGAALYSLVNSAAQELAEDMVVHQLLNWCEAAVKG